jgi:hypothetical protein
MIKKIGTALLAVMLSSSVLAGHDSIQRRSNGLLRFIASNKVMRSVGLYVMMSNRCSRYMNFPDSLLCKTTVARQLQILDYDMTMVEGPRTPGQQDFNPHAFVFVAFKKNLIDLLSEPRTAGYLQLLQEQLTHHLLGKTQANIWEITLRHYRSPLEAAKVIAALFQDTSLAKLHLAYLNKNQIRGRQSFESNKELLSRVINTINLVLDYNQDDYGSLFYPREVKRHLNRNIYHFYVPLYLAMALTHEGFNSIFAQAAPLMMTLSYEFVTAASDYRYIFSDPARLEPVKYDHKLRDIYGGYSGARFGTRQRIAPNFFMSMRETFGRSTEEAVRMLLD